MNMFYLRKQHIYRQENGGEGDGGGGEGGDGKDGSGASQTEGGESNPNTEVEDKARKMGWTPKEEFKGDPGKWRGAAEFVERGEQMLPIVRATVKRQERDIAELKQTINDLAEFNSKAVQKGYEKALRELEAKRVEAVAAGNAADFVKVDQEIADLKKEAATPAPKLPDYNPDNDPEYREWESRNRWLKDPELAAEADVQALYLRNKGNKETGAAFLDKVAERVRKEFPDRFTNPRRNSAPSVEGQGAPAKSGKGKSYADLPTEAKAACDRFVKNSGGKMTKEMYCKTYFEGE
jgi:hypothetical protein